MKEELAAMGKAALGIMAIIWACLLAALSLSAMQDAFNNPWLWAVNRIIVFIMATFGLMGAAGIVIGVLA